ncbi:hypothetical protein AC478_02185 [miscellaneous Crenarchaeota group-1 archaeon SG8-32-3]|uniref:Uncharacterized protein n=1 Tax=miscellaneous Crenarchaeota group-1 archaeon SG8-32-3 TaxID=1685125 RepID=A0A0M0BUD5_9ARCH|nr:MAG: hypothetical protein AC478_02185 [miscellaneous Crenarchaeota group-1 archaeon SG8-32-3]
MKRTLLNALCIITLCSLLIVSAGTVTAAEEGYVRVDFMPDTVPLVIDGKWTTNDEWTLKGAVTMIGNDVAFRSVWIYESQDPIIVASAFLVEFYSDNTTDTGDYWQMCIDGNQDDGTAPATEDYRIDIVGHTDLKVYQGTGSGWAEVSPPGVVTWANSLSASPTNSTPHWILELRFVKAEFGAGPTWNFRLAVFDENSTAGVQAWPPTPDNVPNRWGVQNYLSEIVPEGFSLGVVVLLSSVALAVSFYCLRKRSRTDKYTVGKLGR